MGIKATLDKGLKFLFNYKFTILTILLFVVVSHLMGVNRLNQLLVAYASAVSFLFLLNILAKTKYTLPLTIIFSLLVTVDVFCVYEFERRMSLGIMASIFETNMSEAISMSRTILPLGLCVFGLIFGLIYMSEKELAKGKLSRKLSLGLFLGYWMLFIPILIGTRMVADESARKDFEVSKFQTIERYANTRVPLVVANFVIFSSYLEEIGKLKDYAKMQRVLPYGVSYSSNNDTIPNKIFLVIGESMYRKHLSLYGYKTKTTPFLDSLSFASSSFPKLNFYDAIASATLTRNAMRIMFTFSDAKDETPFYKYKNLVELANTANYETVWISNQDRIGLHDTYIGLISSTADYEYFSTASFREDLDLVEQVEKKIDPSKKQLFVIHLYGNHMAYYDRIDTIDRKAIGGSGIVADYDASIHHTDRVLREISKLQQKSDTSSVLVFVPDHGEVVGVGHGVIDPSEEQLNIPFITISGSDYNIDDIVKKYIEPKYGAISNSNLIYVVSELMGYTFSKERVENALESGQYIYHSDTKAYLYEDVSNKFEE